MPNNSLEIYYEYDFKCFTCSPDKSPAIPKGTNWKDKKNHLEQEAAETILDTGHMIGAWIPEDILVLDLDKHEGKANGIHSFIEIKKQLNLDIELMSSTTVIRTGGGGCHVLFYAPNHGLKQGAIKVDGKEIGIDIKTNAGYIISAGSPGYKYECDAEPMTLPERLHDWLKGVRGENALLGNKVETQEFSVDRDGNKKGLISVKLLKSILNKVKVENFRSNDRWMEFIISAIAAAGNSYEVIDALETWSKSDPQYTNERNIESRIKSFEPEGGISTGSFIHILREEDISKYLISQVIRADEITPIIENGEKTESDLPIPEPDYKKLMNNPNVKEFFTTRGNTSAKLILHEALAGNVAYVKIDKEIFYFNGSRWEVLKDMYSIVYTILFRLSRIFYTENREQGGKEFDEAFKKVMQSINDTTWKSKTITELQAMIREDAINWDSTRVVMETITTLDGVIEFTDGQIKTRKGLRAEYRRSYIPYTSEEILKSKSPENYLDFMRGSFPDSDTLKMAHQLVSLCISGNVSKRIFQLWEGEGSNGKSTLIEIIKEILKGKTNTYNSNLLMPDKFSRSGQLTPDLAKFQGSYAAMATEVEQTAEFSMGTIKNLAGGDTITVNPKFKEERDVEPTWQLILAVNDLPRFNGTDEAFIGRLYILPFVMRFPRDEQEKQKFLRQGTPPEHIGIAKPKNKLQKAIFKEKASIIKFWIETYVNLEKSGGKVHQSKLATDKKNFYIQDNDDFGKFIEDMCVIEPNGFITSNEITESFKDYLGLKKASAKWVITNIKKHNRSIGTASKEVITVGASGYQEKKRRRGLTGIRLKSQTEMITSNMDSVKDDREF